MRNRILIVLTLLILVSLVVSACAAPPAGGGATGGKKKIGLVTDVGGVNDKSFNQSAWAGVQKAAKEFGWDAKFIESKQPTDYEKNIDQFATEKYDVIVTVGFLMGDATAAKAKQYPNIKFAIIDNAYFPTKGSAACDDTKKDCYADGGLKNVTSLMFQEDRGRFPGRRAGGRHDQDAARSAPSPAWKSRPWCALSSATRTAPSGSRRTSRPSTSTSPPSPIRPRARKPARA